MSIFAEMMFILLFVLQCYSANTLNETASIGRGAASVIKPEVTRADETSDAEKIVSFAQTLKGIRYKYGSANPKNGFDCSGFVHYVFKHFGLTVPRSSAAFSKAGKTIALADAAPGDLILFTGTHRNDKGIGHIGIIISKPEEPVRFIHCTSGKEYSVTETAMTSSYRRRFVKTVRIW